MAGKQLNLNTKLMASSILETVVAMVIIVVVFSTAMVILANVLKSSVSVTQIRAAALLKEQMEKTVASTTRDDLTFNSGDIEVRQAILPLAGHTGLVQVNLIAVDHKGRNLAELHQIIKDHAE
ncbi:hypothetical protein ABIB62_004246 [Mucilaginibacter sp. UYP25]|uniref:hypothetical protein n=1 Tax=unclassified Mucilaginibacter TaxID=2617802 RepID=UPI0033917084